MLNAISFIIGMLAAIKKTEKHKRNGDITEENIMKAKRIIYYTATGLLTAQMLFASTLFFIMLEHYQTEFTRLNFPTYIVLPLAIFRLIGLVVIWQNKINWLKEWAYAGFFLEFLLAGTAHINAGDGQQIGAILAMTWLLTSYIMYRQIKRD